jgi:hypothetical protein
MVDYFPAVEIRAPESSFDPVMAALYGKYALHCAQLR